MAGVLGVIKVLHSFKESLAMSHKAEDLPIWGEVYKKAFPDMVGMQSYRADGFWQREGVDRGILLKTSKQLYVDEKVRGRNKKTGNIYEDIALEYLSSKESKTPGWVCKPLRADYIAYLIAPLGKCYLLPVIQMQSAWERNKVEWIGNSWPIQAKNFDEKTGRAWTTLSCAVPVNVLFKEIGKDLRISFEPFEVVI